MRMTSDATLATPANLLSAVRIPMAAALWLAPASLPWVFTLMTMAAVSDILDGAVARWDQARRAARGLPERLGDRIGPWLDPVCDKAFVASLAVALYVTLGPPLWVLVVMATREIVMAIGGLVYLITPPLRRLLSLDFHAGPFGKATTVAQFATLAAVFLLHPVMEPLAVLAGTLGIIATLDYVRRARRHQALVAAHGGEHQT